MVSTQVSYLKCVLFDDFSTIMCENKITNKGVGEIEWLEKYITIGECY